MGDTARTQVRLRAPAWAVADAWAILLTMRSGETRAALLLPEAT